MRQIAWLLIVLLLAIYMIGTTGCTTTGAGKVQPITEVVTKYDLSGTVNGIPFDGIGVIPPAKSYKFRIESKQDVDLVTITSCHRDFSRESVIDVGWFKKNRGFEYVYTPAPGIEDTGQCLIRLGVYNKSVPNQNAFAILDIRTPTETLPARNICDGANGEAGGVSMCQSKVGLIQRLVFPVLVTSLSPDTAPDSIADKPKICVGTWLDASTWEYKLGTGECYMAFMESSKPHRFHRHTAIGYTKVEIRGK